MAKQSINTLKGWFKKGLKPLEIQFAAWLDSYWHKDEAIPMQSVEGLQDALNNVPSNTAITALITALKELGVVTVFTTAELEGKSGSDTKLALLVSVGLFVFQSEGVPDGVTIFPALNGGVWLNSLPTNTGGGGGAWGEIDGNLPDQTDLVAYIQAAINSLINGAPGALDTLAELAAALQDNENFGAEIIALIGAKAPSISPAFSGTPTAPTAAKGTNSSQLATTAFVQQAIDEPALDLGTVSGGTIVLNGAYVNQRVLFTGDVIVDHVGFNEKFEYALKVERTADTKITWAAGRWSCSGGKAQEPKPTDPTVNGSVPPKAVDIFIFKKFFATDLPSISLYPDRQDF